MNDTLLHVNNLTVRLRTSRGNFNAVDGITLSVGENETLALVGESGCGKTMTALAILGLVPKGASITTHSVKLRDSELNALSEEDMRAVRGKKISMIFQEPLSALNPVYSIGEQIAEGLRHHEKLTRRAAWERTVEVLHEVGIPDPQLRSREYPHQLSGGMRQRAMIAVAIACRPSLLIADEPTTALDVSVQAQIIDLLLQLQHERGMSILLITHDLGVVAEMAHHVAVMYAGQIFEQSDVKSLFANPLHPYTRGLLASVPRISGASTQRLTSIEGAVPDMQHLPVGCRFAPRCAFAVPDCRQAQELAHVDTVHSVRCCRASEWMVGNP